MTDFKAPKFGKSSIDWKKIEISLTKKESNSIQTESDFLLIFLRRPRFAKEQLSSQEKSFRRHISFFFSIPIISDVSRECHTSGKSELSVIG